MEEFQLMKRLFTVLAVLAVVAFCVSGMMAEEPQHGHAMLVKHAPSTVHVHASTSTVAVFIPWSDFATAGVPVSNADGSYLWPCFGDYEASSGTFTGNAANPDCPSIGDPSVPFGGGVVVGDPSYFWSLSDCNATSTSSPVCGDQETFVTDNSGDLTDDLLFSLVITQGTSTIYDSGTQDYGVNIFGLTAADFPIIWVNYNPQNFGDMGIAAGPNNGNCLADFNYPLPSAAFNPPYYIVAGGKTCVPAVSGTATGTVTIEYGTPAYTKKTGTACTSLGVPSPCWDVKWTSKFKTTSKFTIDLD